MNFSPEITGVGKYTGEISSKLIEAGMNVNVITTAPHYPGWRVQSGRNRYGVTRDANINIWRCPLILRSQIDGIWRLIAPMSFALSSAPVAVWLIFKTRPKVIFLVEPTLFVVPIAALASKLVGARTILHVQDLEVDAAFAVGHLTAHRYLRGLASVFERWCLRQMSAVVTISNKMSGRLIAKGVAPDRLSIVRNWVDLSAIKPLSGVSPYRKKLGYAAEDFIVLYSGNIGAKQGLPVLLDAAQMLQARQRIRFVIAGEGPAKRELMERYKGLANVRFLPFQPEARFNEFLGLADLHALIQDAGAADLVLPSKLGAMLASGKPVLATAEADTELHSSFDDVLEIVPPGDPVAVADGIAKHFESVPDVKQSLMRIKKAEWFSKETELPKIVELVKRQAPNKPNKTS